MKNPTNVILGTSDFGTAHLPVLGSNDMVRAYLQTSAILQKRKKLPLFGWGMPPSTSRYRRMYQQSANPGHAMELPVVIET